MMNTNNWIKSPVRMTKMNKYDTNFLRIFTMNHRVREKRTDSGSTMKRKLLDENWIIEEKRWEGGEKQRQLETDEITPERIERMTCKIREDWIHWREAHRLEKNWYDNSGRQELIWQFERTKEFAFPHKNMRTPLRKDLKSPLDIEATRICWKIVL